MAGNLPTNPDSYLFHEYFPNIDQEVHYDGFNFYSDGTLDRCGGTVTDDQYGSAMYPNCVIGVKPAQYPTSGGSTQKLGPVDWSQDFNTYYDLNF